LSPVNGGEQLGGFVVASELGEALGEIEHTPDVLGVAGEVLEGLVGGFGIVPDLEQLLDFGGGG
jgi:hypothetical protein